MEAAARIAIAVVEHIGSGRAAWARACFTVHQRTQVERPKRLACFTVVTDAHYRKTNSVREQCTPRISGQPIAASN